MVKKQLLNPERVRKIKSSFAFIEHRFLRKGFWASLTHHELLLYFFLILVADRQGIDLEQQVGAMLVNGEIAELVLCKVKYYAK